MSDYTAAIHTLRPALPRSPHSYGAFHSHYIDVTQGRKFQIYGVAAKSQLTPCDSLSPARCHALGVDFKIAVLCSDNLKT